MKKNASSHYTASYFKYQKEIGEFGGWVNLSKFKDYIKETDNVIDFGGGYLLKNIQCKDKILIEVNDVAIDVAIRINGIKKVYKDSEKVPDEWADVIISSGALEHVLYPLEELRNLYGKLKRGGTIVFAVPCESISYKYVPRDINHHLYSWSPMCLGNLFEEAGFRVKESKPYIHKWPPYYNAIARIFGKRIFDLCCIAWGHIDRKWFMVRVVAKK